MTQSAFGKGVAANDPIVPGHVFLADCLCSMPVRLRPVVNGCDGEGAIEERAVGVVVSACTQEVVVDARSANHNRD